MGKKIGVHGTDEETGRAAEQTQAPKEGPKELAAFPEKAKKDKSTRCPITKEAFLAAAKPLNVTIDGMAMTATPFEFSTGSFGWRINNKVPIKVGETTVELSIGANLTVIGSKDKK